MSKYGDIQYLIDRPDPSEIFLKARQIAGIQLQEQFELFNKGKSQPIINFSKIKEALFSGSGSMSNSFWLTSISILAICVTINMLAILFLVFHNLVGYLRKNQDIFKAVHGLLIMFLIGSIIF